LKERGSVEKKEVGVFTGTKRGSSGLGCGKEEWSNLGGRWGSDSRGGVAREEKAKNAKKKNGHKGERCKAGRVARKT